LISKKLLLNPFNWSSSKSTGTAKEALAVEATAVKRAAAESQLPKQQLSEQEQQNYSNN
jgi:hypothetical protein